MKPEYYHWIERDNPIRYVLRIISCLKAMTPRARKYGVQYYFSRKFRRRIHAKERRKLRGAGFMSRIKEIRLRIGKERGHCCAWCRGTEQLELDHIIPVSKGGSNDDTNLQILCRWCHVTKTKIDEGVIDPGFRVLTCRR